MASLARRSPLAAHWSGDRAAVWRAEGLSLSEEPFSGKLLLRGAVDPDVGERIADVLGSALPTDPCVLRGTIPRVLWMAPSRWLVLAAADRVSILRASLVAATADSYVSVSDFSDGRVEIAAEGRLAAELLAAGTTIDLHPRAFPVGSAAQTQLARIGALVYRGGPDSFGIIVDASVAVYAWEWLTQTGARVVAAGAPSDERGLALDAGSSAGSRVD